jgi:SAM-dependent methyltransferase
MGLARGAIRLLMQEASRKPFAGRIATLGRQTISVSGGEFARLLAERGGSPQTIASPRVDDRTLFTALGFSEVASIDYSDYEGATHIFDLNQPDLPEKLKGQFDVVLDSGTLEHVFHVPNALKNICAMVKVGGRIIMQTPSSNHFDHGFYMFSPTLFFDYFTANRFAIDTLHVIRYSPDPAQQWDVYQYQPGKWDDLQCGGLDGNPYLIFVVATKTAQSTGDVIPQQGFYAASSPLFAGARTATASPSSLPQNESAPGKTSMHARLGALLKKLPLADRLARKILRRIRKTLWSKQKVGSV